MKANTLKFLKTVIKDGYTIEYSRDEYKLYSIESGQLIKASPYSFDIIDYCHENGLLDYSVTGKYFYLKNTDDSKIRKIS